MGGNKLCLLLLLGTYTLAQPAVENDAQSPLCLLAKRFKNFKRFVYNYEAETLNGIHRATNINNGPKLSCKVEIDVPQTCSFILRTTECSLSEVVGMNTDETPEFGPAAGAESFKAAMARNPLKFVVDGQTDVKLFPEEDEPTNILNVKRGIVSALIVPVIEEDRNREMATVHGVCATEFTVNSREDIATDVTVSRELSRCDGFSAQREHTSPLALISGMNYPLSKMISSTQTCDYKFDNQKKHMTSASCNEKHVFLPLSHQDEYGVSTLVKQTLTLREHSKINDRVFDNNEANLKFLPMEVAEDKSPIQTKDAVMAAMRALSTMAQRGHQRAITFQRLVSELRALKTDVLKSTALEMLDISKALTWQALTQCGTPECTSAIMAVLRTFDQDAMEVDATVYALGMMLRPSRLLAQDMLAMAQYKKSKSIMFALSNVVRKLYQVEGVTPEITAASEFLTSILGTDCAGEKDLTYMTLRVIGNIGDAMEAADPSVKTILLKCMRQPTTTLSVQLAAIQAFRRMTISDDVRSNLQRVSQYAKGAVQKRLAAYLILMRNPVASDIELVKKILKQEQNAQVKAFVTSHVYNIISSTDPETKKLGEKILEAFQSDVDTHTEYTTMSRNYKLGLSHDNMQANILGNVIFDSSSQLPREAMLETTLNAFGYNIDMWEVGMEGKGFEPTIEALFGTDGFFPDTVSKALYWAEDKMPKQINEVLKKWTAPLRTAGQQKVPENLVKEILNNFNKLAKVLQTQETPEAMAYLRIMGNELGFIKGSELNGIAEYAAMYAEIFQAIIPVEAMKRMVSNVDNELFAYYIFMDNKFSLPTASGLPLKFALSGTFAPGMKGGLRFTPNMKEFSFMPSMGIEFVTKMGVHVPEFVVSAVEMHTNMYHESALNAKISMGQGQVKLSFPAPQGTTQLFKISNRMLSVGAGQVNLIPLRDGESRTNIVNCRRLFSGVKYCTTASYFTDGIKVFAPYFPISGETEFAVDIQATGEVTEYTATVAYKLLSEGKDGRQKVDSLKIILSAEGADTSEATATMKYNRNRNVFTTSVQIPDFDVEAGIKVAMSDSNSRGKSVTLDITNKNIPQLSLIGRGKFQSNTDGMLQVQLLVPSFKTDAAITATMRNTEDLTIELRSDIKLPETSSIQAVTFRYGMEQAEIQLMSNMNSDIKTLVSYTEAIPDWSRQFVDDMMDQQVVMSDMKVRHIFTKTLEASNIWMDKMTYNVPYVHDLRKTMAEVEMPSMPDKLFMNLESTFKYQFNKDRMTITIPLPLGGKTSKELRIPPMLTIPSMSFARMGLVVDRKEINVPTFTIPSDYDLTLPLMGMVEMSAKVNSNYYKWEGMVAAGNNTAEFPSYIAKYKIMAESPIEVLSFTYEGAAEISDTSQETVKITVDGSLKNQLIDTSVGFLETIVLSDKILSTSSYKFQAFSPMGMQTSMDITSQCSLASDMLTGDANMDGSLTLGSVSATSTYSQSFTVEPVRKQARTESTLRVNSAVIEVMNKMKAVYANEQLLIESNTNMNNDPVKHTTKFSMGFKDAQLTIQSDSVTKAHERMIRSQVDFTASRTQTSIRVENQADDTQNRAYSLISGSLKPDSVEINTDASINIFLRRASHKATLTFSTFGLSTSCTTTAQSTQMTFENVFHGGVDTSGATMSLNTKGTNKENTAELNVDGKIRSTEIYLNSMLKGNVFDANTRNRLNLRLDENGLSFTNNLVGSLNEMKTETTHTITLTLTSLLLQSKTDNFLNNRNSYKHDITVDMKQLIASVIVENDLKIMDVNFVNQVQLEAQPYKMAITGTMMGALSEESLKHIYEIKFENMILSAISKINGKLLGSHLTYTTDTEVAGLTIKFNNAANFNSPSLRLDSTVKSFAAPFTLNIDAVLNSNGGLYLYGQQNGELYSKFLLKAEPMLFLNSFEHRASTTHELENGVSIKTNIDNKFKSMITLKEQVVTLKMTSKLNNHVFEQEMSVYNKDKVMGIELNGNVITPLFNKASENNDYSISGYVKYDKNSDSHFIQIPFIEHLPEVIDEVKTAIVKSIDYSIEMLKDIDTKYGISTKVHERVSELKHVINTFDFKLFIQDLKNMLNSAVNHIHNMTANIPFKEIVNVLKSFKEDFMAWIKKHNFAKTVNVIYSKFEEFLSSYEVENIIEQIMGEAVEIMKQYQVREKLWSAITALKSIDIQAIQNKILAPVKTLMNELFAFDFKQMIDDLSFYLIKKAEQIKSFDYETFTINLKENVAEISKIPCFGKLYGEFKIISPDYSLTTTAELQNITTLPFTPEFIMNLNSQATSTYDILAYTLDASTHLALPERSHLSLNENIKVVHTAFTFDHQGTVTLSALSVQASAKTIAKVTTEPYEAEMINNAAFTMENGISAIVMTKYKHDMNMPLTRIFTKLSINDKTVVHLKDGTLSITVNNTVEKELDLYHYKIDATTQKTDMVVVMDLHTLKVNFNGETTGTNLQIKQFANAEICIFRHIIIDAKTDTKTAFMNSVAELNVQAKVEDLKIDVTASHNTDLTGENAGTFSNSFLMLASPYEFMLDTKNKGNSKITLPFKQVGKIDLQNDIAITLKYGVQQASWTGLARFNQYKYSHSLAMENGIRQINIFTKVNGAASLDMLKEPITIPEMTVPYFGVKTPKVESYSLWEDTGLSKILITTQQTFDLDAKLKYMKNPELNMFYFGMQKKILIPAMGDLIYEFTVKTAMVTLKTDASIVNQGDIIVRLDASSSSEFAVLTGKIAGTATLNRLNGVKLASILSVKHIMVEGTHDSTVSFRDRVVDASITNSAKVNLPVLSMEINQEMFGNPQEGLIVSLSSPSAGLVGIQVQTKHPAQIKGRLYGRYPTDPTNDIDILAMKVSVLKKLSIQTTWNMEVPNEIMLGLKKKIPTVMPAEIFQEIENNYNEFTKLAGQFDGSFEQVKEQGKVMFKRAADNLKTLDLSNISILRMYQYNVKHLLDAAIKFLRETRFSIPGFGANITGLEFYHKITKMFANVTEEAIVNLPKFLSSKLTIVLDYFRSLEITFPGSSYVVRGSEILDKLHLVINKIQIKVVNIVRKVERIQLEEIITRLSKFMYAAVEKAEELLETLEYQNAEILNTWVRAIYNEVRNSPVLFEINIHIADASRLFMEYTDKLKAKFQDVFDDMSIEQFHADIKSWIDFLVKSLNAFHNNIIHLLKVNTKKIEPFVRVSDRQIDIDILLPFYRKSS